jgi:1-deoxy-D-xylulose-5-phosphate reductoisomerase
MSRKRIAILGATGSIGRNTLRIVDDASDRFDVVALAGGFNVALLAAQIERYRPSLVAVADRERAKQLRSMVKRRVRIVSGVEGAIEVAACEGIDVVVSAMVGAAGLAPTLAAVEAGRTVALANKETLVVAGELVMRRARACRSKIIPVDSEHSAVFQALAGEKKKSVRRIVLTASGGPFRTTPHRRLAAVTVAEALAHPNWCMGKKITVDSATLMNKGLEVIEARWLFGFDADRIDVVVHPQSIIHSMVEFIDSSVIAQMGLPDMRAPIGYALAWPDRRPLALPSLDLATVGTMTFEAPDTGRFPALRIAYDALRAGGSAPAALNAANEVAVDAFLAGAIGFTDIPAVVEESALGETPSRISTLADALRVDRATRIVAQEKAAARAARRR